jgi:CRISPR type III-A-associated RAMP protein Csm4
MQPALLIRLRPLGPWRYGPGDGAPDRVDDLYRSDRLFSAVTIAMQQLGYLDEWLDATARAREPAVAFSSVYPYQGDTLFAIPPATLWPPPAAQVTAPNSIFLAKIRWKAARFVPLSAIDVLLTAGRLLADQWLPDPESRCLLRRDRPSSSPFRIVSRASAAVDRITGAAGSAVYSSCVEFEPGAGLWALARYRDAAAQTNWNARIEAAFRLLADDGFGGKRSRGWGHTQEPEFQGGNWPNLLLPKLGRLNTNGSAPSADDASRYWMLSLYSPGSADSVDWRKGDYTVTLRAGRVESRRNSGMPKRLIRMIAEGSVLVAASEPAGAAVDVAPDGFAHPVYRSGLALALAMPQVAAQAVEEIQTEARPAEEPQTEEAIVEVPCEPPSEPEQNAQPSPGQGPGQPEFELSDGSELPAAEPQFSAEEHPQLEAEAEPSPTIPEKREEEQPADEKPAGSEPAADEHRFSVEDHPQPEADTEPSPSIPERRDEEQSGEERPRNEESGDAI